MTQLGKYKLHEQLGKGGFGTVYRATDSIGRAVAIKVLKSDFSDESSVIDRFRQEALAAGSLFHPHIATIIDFDEIDGLVFLVMRYIDGEPLDQIIKESGCFNWDTAVIFLKQIAEGLAFAHKKGFLHRDIKPSNIIISPSEGAVITDFGLAKAATTSGLSTTGVVLGTPSYIAPEIWSGEDATPATDVYSLACVFFEMLTGKVLFDGESSPEIMKKHFDPVQLPDKWPEGVPEGIAEVFSHALEPDINQRYGDISSLIKSLELINRPGKVLGNNNKELNVTSNDSQDNKFAETPLILTPTNLPPTINEKQNPSHLIEGRSTLSLRIKKRNWGIIIPLIILCATLICLLIPWIIIELTDSYCALFPGIFNSIQPGICP